MNSRIPKRPVLGVELSVASFRETVEVVADLAAAGTSSYVCCVNSHMCVEAHNDVAFRQIVNEADLATPDGMPMLHALNRFHRLRQERVAGNDLMPAVLAEAERRGLRVFLYGGTQEVLDRIVARAASEHPTLRIAGSFSPPFREPTEEELRASARRIVDSGAAIVLVSLGCPRQERWMASMKGHVPAVMLGVGGAFLLYAGVDSRAPKWMRDVSLEWLYRLGLEPRRLWKRYATTNSAFVLLYLREVNRRRRAE